MRNRNVRILRTTATIGIAATMIIGAGATAPAQPALDPSAATDVVDAVTDAATAGERVQVGENIKVDGFYDTLYEVALFKQVTSGAKTTPGGEVTMRLEAEGVQGAARVGQLHNVMPAGFELVSVARVENVDGAETTTEIGSGGYDVRANGLGGSTISVRFGESAHEHPQIRPGETVTLEYVFRAPQEVGTYGHGATANLSWASAGYFAEGGADTGAQAIEVAEAPAIIPPGGSTDIDWGSIFGSLGIDSLPGLDSIDSGSLNQGDEDQDQ